MGDLEKFESISDIKVLDHSNKRSVSLGHMKRLAIIRLDIAKAKVKKKKNLKITLKREQKKQLMMAAHYLVYDPYICYE